jgi:hypothetical protein
MVLKLMKSFSQSLEHLRPPMVDLLRNSMKEINMREKLKAGAIALALLGPVGFATAQNDASPPHSGAAPETLVLDPIQEHNITQGLKSQRAQPAPSGYQGQVGTQVPDSITSRSLPSDVTAQVPQTQGYFYVKMPHRVLLIDPQSKTVVEIVDDESTTGLDPSNKDNEDSDVKQRQ